MTQRHGILISIAPVSPSTPPDDQCAGICKNGSRCKRFVKGKAFCHSHKMQLLVAEPISVAEAAPLTMNSITSQIPSLLPSGYYQCTGITKTGSRCKRNVKGRGYCHSHAMQPLKPEPTSAVPRPETTSPVLETEPTSAAEAPLTTMNSIISRIPNLLSPGYYQCAGISKNGSRCKWHVKDSAYCHFHDMQLLEAISHSQADKDVVIRMITQVRSRRQKGEPMHEDPLLADVRDSLRHWAPLHVSNFSNLLLNITKGPLESSERNQDPHAVVPKFNHSYLCRGRTKLGRSCRMRTVGGFYCRHHDPSGISGCDMAMAFASI